MEHPPEFLSLGMVVLDELHLPSGEILYDVIGGSGAYSTLGARIATPFAAANTVACIVIAGEDFPGPVIEKLKSCGVNLQIRRVSGKESTRGLLKYEDEYFGRKSFRYVTEPLRVTPKDLENTVLLQAKAFHFLANPEDLEKWRVELLSLRGPQNVEVSKNPSVVWEPAPMHCRKENRGAHLSACKLVDVFSPNHLELAKLFGDEDTSGPAFNRREIEKYARQCLEANGDGKEHSMIIVVRAGEHGAMTLSRTTECKWFPPFHGSDSNKIVDTTGAGNIFLGAFAVALQQSGDLEEAMTYGSVAASFAVEQVGLPARESICDLETWNGVTFEARLREYRQMQS